MKGMAKQLFLDTLPFLGTLAILALFATVALSGSRRGPDIYSDGGASAESAGHVPEQEIVESLWRDAMRGLNRP